MLKFEITFNDLLYVIVNVFGDDMRIDYTMIDDPEIVIYCKDEKVFRCLKRKIKDIKVFDNNGSPVFNG